MLKIEHLKKNYENFSLDCSLEVKKGHVTGAYVNRKIGQPLIEN